MFTELSGSFQSPGYPDNYPNNARCTYDIRVPRNMKILLVIHSFDLETSDDKLELRQMVSGSNNFVTEFTGTEIAPRNYTSAENKFTLFFRSNPIDTRGGFKASYSAIGGKQFNMLFYRKLFYVSYMPRHFNKLSLAPRLIEMEMQAIFCCLRLRSHYSVFILIRFCSYK